MVRPTDWIGCQRIRELAVSRSGVESWPQAGSQHECEVAVAEEVDVLIITPLRAEIDEVKTAASAGGPGWSGVSGWEVRDAGTSTPYWWGQIQTASGRVLSMALARPSGIGGRLTASLTTDLLARLQPSCLAMCGVCAGNPSVTGLGDVVIADSAYEWDEGRLTGTGFEGDHQQLPLDRRWRYAVEEFDPSVLPSYGAADEDESTWWLLERLVQNQDPREHPARSRYFPPGTWARRLIHYEESGKIVRAADGTVRLTPDGSNLVKRRVYDDVDGPRQLPFSVVTGPMASLGRTDDQNQTHTSCARPHSCPNLLLEIGSTSQGIDVSHDDLPVACIDNCGRPEVSQRLLQADLRRTAHGRKLCLCELNGDDDASSAPAAVSVGNLP
jgi:nucleoside phosphorylase